MKVYPAGLPVKQPFVTILDDGSGYHYYYTVHAYSKQDAAKAALADNEDKELLDVQWMH